MLRAGEVVQLYKLVVFLVARMMTRTRTGEIHAGVSNTLDARYRSPPFVYICVNIYQSESESSAKPARNAISSATFGNAFVVDWGVKTARCPAVPFGAVPMGVSKLTLLCLQPLGQLATFCWLLVEAHTSGPLPGRTPSPTTRHGAPPGWLDLSIS